MKRRLYFAALSVAIILVSCARVDESAPSGDSELLHELTLFCDSTRTTIDGNTPKWKTGDAIWLSDGNNTFKATVPQEYNGLTYTKLTYSGLSEDSSIYALYPYDENAYVSDGRIISLHPTVQDGTFATCHTVQGVAPCNQKTIALHNTSALLEFYHNREDIAVMQLSNASGDSLSGGGCNVSVQFTGTGSKYFSVLPTTLTAGSRFTFVTGDGRLGYIATQNDNLLNAGSSYDLGNIDDRITVDSSPATDLSAEETANCYVIPSAGSYCIKAVKGNCKDSTLSVAFADVLWETHNTSTAPSCHSLVQDCIASDNKIYFRIPSGFKDGNALLAAFDKQGNILWSWHLWIVAGGISEQSYSDGSLTFSEAVMQDRNLGALTATAGNATTGGLLYQYGRKDPFFGSAELTSKVKYGFASHYFTQLPATVSSDAATGTKAYSAAHPQTFIFKGTNSHWLYTKDNTVWNASKKTIYDPCPAGYHIPEESAMDGQTLSNTTWDATKAGRSITIDGQSIWWPSSGYLSSSSAAFQYVGKQGYYWYDMQSSANSYNCWHVCDTAVGNANKLMVYALAYSVRCQKKVSTEGRQTLKITLTTSVAQENFRSPIFYGSDFTGKLSWGDASEVKKLSLTDTAVFFNHKYETAATYQPSALCYGIDSVTFTSIGSVTHIDLSDL